MIDGLVIVDKPAGMTSHDVVARCRRVFGQRRVGHAGTLDPDATGVLLVGLGRATRLMQFLSGLDKSYACEVVLGVATHTLDASGAVTGTWDMSTVTLEQAREATRDLVGELDQVPPMVSALKVGGRRLHQLARAGVEVERAPRRVSVKRFELSMAADGGGGPGGPAGDAGCLVLAAEIDCSSGTYVRSLAADLGASLGGGAHVRRLRRTAVGPWGANDAVALDQVAAEDVISPLAAMSHLPSVVVDTTLEVAVGHGQVLDRSRLGLAGDGPWAVVGGDGRLLAVYRAHGPDSAKPSVVLVDEGAR